MKYASNLPNSSIVNYKSLNNNNGSDEFIIESNENTIRKENENLKILNDRLKFNEDNRNMILNQLSAKYDVNYKNNNNIINNTYNNYNNSNSNSIMNSYKSSINNLNRPNISTTSNNSNNNLTNFNYNNNSVSVHNNNKIEQNSNNNNEMLFDFQRKKY